MSDNTVVLITGSNRGIGLGFVKAYLARPNHTVIAAVRDPSKSKGVFESLTPASNSRVIVVRIDSTDRGSAKAAIEEIQQQQQHGINHLDVVIANAGISKENALGDIRDFNIDTLSEHHEVNTVAPVALYQATRPLLQKSRAKKGPIFAPISTLAASIGGLGYMSKVASYGASKAALNLLFVRAHTEILFHNGELKPNEDISRLGEKGVVPYEVIPKTGEEARNKDRLAIVIFHPG